MQYSTNFNLNKPERADQYNLDHWNGNTDIIDTELNALQNITNSTFKTALLNFCYPVGSLYWSSKSTNPGTLFGGTWAQIKDRFVLACGDTYNTTGATGGASSVTLSVSNMPSHNHSFTPSGEVSSDFKGNTQDGSVRMDNANNGGSSLGAASGVFFTSGESPISLDSGSWSTRASTLNFSMKPSGTVSSSFKGYEGTTSSNGSGTAFSILPPYVVKYCWERTA